VGYRELHASGELARRCRQLHDLLGECRLCPRRCQARRLEGERGACGAGREVEVASYGPHFGEEFPLVGAGGSGTVFFSWCSLRCVYCQNYSVSRGRERRAVATEQLAAIMLHLQQRGCANVNLVTPTHYVPHIVEALGQACRQGLSLPLVYNSSGYEEEETLRLLDGVVDIYLPDLKYSDARVGLKYSGVADYPQAARAALKEMYRQVGDLALDANGLAVRGVLIRHLVLPGGLAGTGEAMEFIARELSPTACINLMDQYYPAYHARRYPELSRRISGEEFAAARECALRASPRFRLL
jgi:putative pyruvate formate lyase activating enzyme